MSTPLFPFDISRSWFWNYINKLKTGLKADFRKTFNAILYAVIIGCRWSDVPRIQGAKSTVHRPHLELCKSGTFDEIFRDLRSVGHMN